MKVPVAPFLTPDPDSLSHAPWMMATSEGLQPLPAEMPAWDHMMVLELTTEIEIDVDDVLSVCELGEGTQLALWVRATCDTTSIRRVVSSSEVPAGGRRRVPVHVELPGHELGGRLTLETLLTSQKPVPSSEIAASQPGSILWRSISRTKLQGTGSQFPTDAADFHATGRPDPEAAWELQVDLTNPEAVFMSAVRLTLNTAHPAIVRLLEGAKDDNTQQLRRTLHWDVTRQLVQYALDCEEAMTAEFDAEATTLAGVLRNVLALVWPATSTSTLRVWSEQDPARLETHIQQHCRLVP